MARARKEDLRQVTEEERLVLARTRQATSARVDRTRRATALLAVADGATFTAAAQQAGYQSPSAVTGLVRRFNQVGDDRARSRSQTRLRRSGTGTDRGHRPATGRPARGWDGHLVIEHAGTDPAAGGPAPGRSHHRATGAGGGRGVLSAHPHLVPDRHGPAEAHQRGGDGDRPADRAKKGLIEQAYRLAEAVGLPVWCQDEAGPYQIKPHAGTNWQSVGQPARQSHEYIRGGTVKLLTLFRPATGEARARGVTTAPNVVLHPWLKAEVTTILASLPPLPAGERPALAQWATWLGHPPWKPLPPLRLILIWDNLAGHTSWAMVRWLFEQGVMPLYTPLSGSWLNMAESLQRIIVSRALAGQHPSSQAEAITWLEETVAGGNAAPTPFVWDGKRRERRRRARQRRLGGSGAALLEPHPIAA